MGDLFRVETDRVLLVWGTTRDAEPAVLAPAPPPPGRLVVRPRRAGIAWGAQTWRAGVPDGAAGRVDLTEGPRLFEETAYSLYLRATGGATVAVEHRDPVLLRGLRASEGGRVVHGRVDFAGQVGRSELTVRVDGVPEFDLEVEVFPTKLDYAEDYARLRAETGEILAGLVLEYLRSTFHLGVDRHAPHPTRLEWLALLRHAAADLERAVAEIARQPRWGLAPAAEPARAERVRRPDARVRRALLRGAGAGRAFPVAEGAAARERVPEGRPRPTLDTPEHRWIAAELLRARRRLAGLLREESELPPTPRRARSLEEIGALERRIARLLRAGPLAAAAGPPPPGLASPQLLRAPGYREAHRALLLLRLGLHLEGGPVRLAVKDLGVLYEYWCFLALARVLARATGQALPAHRLLAVEEHGLRVLLRRGREHSLVFETTGGGRAVLVYNPRFGGEPLLVPQQPDFLLEVHHPGGETTRVVLDAKYRIDASPEYTARYGSPGPPEDALNVLHRYRDAIVRPGEGRAPERMVTRAAALFPFREAEPGVFRESRLWRSLEGLGVGAIPLLPGSTEYLEEWVGSLMVHPSGSSVNS
ncbi:MAG TPA: DUF2357 domain-containing protein [Longimicrobiaceae bacterium]|nr:DUF2357 domain-containing protein [Longimicrobiaceae bacterium]